MNMLYAKKLFDGENSKTLRFLFSEVSWKKQENLKEKHKLNTDIDTSQ